MQYKYPDVSPYVYCAGNPVKYVDPDGNFVWVPLAAAVGAVAGAAISVTTVALSDLATGQTSSLGEYVGVAVGGAVSGAILATTGNSIVAGAAGGLAGDLTNQIIDNGIKGISVSEAVVTMAEGAVIGSVIKGSPVKGITCGRNSMKAVAQQIDTKISNNTIKSTSVSLKTASKMTTSRFTDGAMVEGSLVNEVVNKGVVPVVQEGAETIELYKSNEE